MPRLEIATLLLLTGTLAATGCDDAESPTGPSASASPAVGAAVAAVWTRVEAGAEHTCALASNARAYCWGDNVNGQVGSGSTAFDVPAPTRVSGNHQFVQITAGLTHTCAVTANGKAYCWGENLNGQLGDGTTTDRSTPVPVSGTRRFTQIRAGAYHTCALNPNSKVFCWGDNGFGQVGDGTRTERHAPVALSGGLTVRRLSAGGLHSCAVTTADKAYCWGHGHEGQLGQGTAAGSTKPVAVSGGLSFLSVVAGSDHTCGITSLQRGYCWGSKGTESYNGQLGIGNVSNGSSVPTPVSGTRKWCQMIAGHLHSCGITQTNVPFCWGWNSSGQNGDGGQASTYVPTRVAGGHSFVGVTTGSQEASLFVNDEAEHSCGITSDGRIYCWGSNGSGQLGNGPSTPILTPTQVPMPS